MKNASILSEPEILRRGKLQVWQQEALFSKARVRSLAASRQIGKSVTLRAICLKEMLENPGIQILYLCPTIKQCKAIGFRPMFLANDSIFPEHLIKSINKTEMSVELTNGSRIMFAGTEAIEKLRGLTCDLLILDEYAIMSSEVMTVLEPIISARNGRIVIAATPKGYNHFHDIIQKGILGTAQFVKGYRSWIVPIDDERVVVPFKEQRIANAKSTMSIYAYEQEYRCSFSALKGAVYPSYSVVHNQSNKELNRDMPLFIGLDFNVGKMCAVVAQRYPIEHKNEQGRIIRRTEDIHIVDEVVIENTNTQAMANELKRRYGTQWEGRIFIYPDASGSARKTSATLGSTDHTILQSSGFNLQVPKKNPEISDRVNAVNAKLCNAAEERMLFVHPRCKTLIQSLTSQAYDKNGKPEKKNGVDDLSGPVDALGYMINFIYPINSNTPTVTHNIGR